MNYIYQRVTCRSIVLVARVLNNRDMKKNILWEWEGRIQNGGQSFGVYIDLIFKGFSNLNTRRARSVKKIVISVGKLVLVVYQLISIFLTFLTLGESRRKRN